MGVILISEVAEVCCRFDNQGEVGFDDVSRTLQEHSKNPRNPMNTESTC